MNTKTILVALSLCVAGMGESTAYAAPTPTVVQQTTTLPEIWQNVPAAQRLQYVRAAELDATRILAERIAGIKLDGDTTVKDLCAASDTVRGQLAATLKGVKTTQGPIYHDDGRVEVVRAVKVKNLIESIKTQSINGKKAKDIVAIFPEIEELDALGNSAIKDSVGYGRIKAKRAAEMDVYRRLAERIAGVQITTDSTIKDFAVQDDTIQAGFSNLLKSTEIVGISYTDDTASVTAKVKVGPLVRTIKKVRSGDKVTVTSDTVEQLTIEETGIGAANAAPEQVGQESAATTSEPTSEEIDIIVSSVITTNTTVK